MLLSVSDPYAAYCLDNAVSEFGRTIEGEIKRINAKNQKEMDVKSERLLRKWLDMPQRYRDPVRSGHVQLPSKGGEE